MRSGSSEISPYRVAVVSPRPLLRETLSAALADAGLAATATDAASEATWDDLVLFRPAVAIVYAGRGKAPTSAQLTKQVRERSPTTKVLVLSDSDDERALLDAFSLGAHAFLTISASLADADRAVRRLVRSRVHADRNTIDQLTSASVPRPHVDGSKRRHPASGLTQRENEVLDLLGVGGSTDDIATALDIKPATVRRHVNNVLAKLGVHSRLEAVTHPHPAQAG